MLFHLLFPQVFIHRIAYRGRDLGGEWTAFVAPAQATNANAAGAARGKGHGLEKIIMALRYCGYGTVRRVLLISARMLHIGTDRVSK